MTEREKPEKPRGMRGLGRVYGRQHGPAPRNGELDKRPTIWWIEFWHDGVQHRESSHSKKHSDAVRLLRRRHAQVAQGHLMVTADKVTFEDLAAMVTADYTVNGRDLRRAKLALAHLRETFGHTRAVNIAGQLDAWVATRREAKDAPASIKRDLSVLGRAFSLAVRSGRLPFRPRLPDLAVENTRTESFTQTELDGVLRVLMHGAPATAKDPALRAQPDLVPPIVFAAASGWRLTSDVFTIKWSQVDFTAGTVTRWSRGTSKASRHVVFPFGVMPEVAALLQRQRELTSALERQTGSIVPWVFHRRGRAIKDLYAAWRGACRRAGVPGRVPHDLRRAAARTLRTLGMDDRDIAEIVGWDTQVMVSRYLGRDPAGVADRLRLKVAESRTRTFPARFQDAASGGEDG